MALGGRDMAVHVAMSLALHFFVFAGVIFTPALQAERFQVPVAYEVRLVNLPPVRDLPASKPVRPSKAPQVKAKPVPKPPPPKVEVKPAPPPKVEAPKPEVKAPAPRDQAALTFPTRVSPKPKTPEPPPAPPIPAAAPPPPAEPAVRPPQPIYQAALPTPALPAPPPAAAAEPGASRGVVSESSVSTESGDPQLGYYLAAVQARIGSRWVEPPLNLGPGQVERVSVSFVVLRNGFVRDIRIVQPSGDEFLDRSALRAVQEAIPLPHFPPLFQRETLVVRFHFVMRGES
ncbi:MAG: energy transducer TonB [Candidatus Methylomirabilales bacterium]